MPIVVPVRMHFNMQDLWFNPKQTGASEGDYVVVSTERGTEFGLVTAAPFVASVDEVKGELKPVLRVATDEDVAHAEKLAAKGDEAMPVFRELVKASGLDMKPVGVEFLFGGEKVVFYFAAEDRVDFRDLVRDLASRFHQRVDMRQIGVRDEARLVGGYAPCGQELCCVRFGGEFEPVSIRMAKEQDLPLNSAKISGVCGRLMCCLRYEFEAYRDFKQRAPKKNALIDTPLGKAKIVEYNTPRETLTLRLENGKSFVVALADMTCSEGCCKRSAEQHTPLRPDTVTREALEKLGTPDIVMQLAELDRANGGDGAYVLDDSLLDGARTPRRRQTDAADAPAGAPRRSKQTQKPAGSREQQETTVRTPRRKSAGAGKDQTAAEAPAGQARRTHRQPAAAADQQTPAQEAAERRQPRGGGMRPRRTAKTPNAGATGSCQASPAGDARPPKPERKVAPRPNATGQSGQPARPDPKGEATANAPAAQTRRTRRHHNAATGADPVAGEQQRPRREGRPTRERPAAERPDGTPGPDARKEQQPNKRRSHSQPAERTGADDAKPRRKRRPGDRGGMQDGTI